MQRMLVFLVLVLLAAVAVLGVVVTNLSSTVSEAALASDSPLESGCLPLDWGAAEWRVRMKLRGAGSGSSGSSGQSPRGGV